MIKLISPFLKIGIIFILLISVITSLLSIASDTTYFPNDRFTYSAVHIDQQHNIISRDTIEVYISGRPWSGSSRQLEATYKILNETKPISTLRIYSYDIDQNSVDVTGFIDNDYRVWNHPIRIRHYYLLELAPFPTYHKNSEIGSKATTTLKIGRGWGKFKGKSRRKYTLEETQKFKIQNTNLRCSYISAKSRHRLGKSNSKFYFHTIYGFVFMEHHLFNGDKITFLMIDHNRLAKE